MDKKRKELNRIEWKTKNKNKLKIIINAECVFFISQYINKIKFPYLQH